MSRTAMCSACRCCATSRERRPTSTTARSSASTTRCASWRACSWGARSTRRRSPTSSRSSARLRVRCLRTMLRRDCVPSCSLHGDALVVVCVLADFLEAEPLVEAPRYLVWRLEVELAGDERDAGLAREGEHIEIKRGRESLAALGRRHDHPVDVDERRVALAEPAVVRAVVARAFAECEEEGGDTRVAGDQAVIGRPAVQALEARLAHRTQE